ncbi:hypothetical protein F2Q69_00039138 [Brassica cretica]|uniref:Uncharacterized protein n=1 Tax=Brassica cretica TaxID=69181 RepID=A0A8S9SNP4_BRACR|nr:hypothetical protein F2Q69_00039138 [Brassica cretica]
MDGDCCPRSFGPETLKNLQHSSNCFLLELTHRSEASSGVISTGFFPPTWVGGTAGSQPSPQLTTDSLPMKKVIAMGRIRISPKLSTCNFSLILSEEEE